jgi:hypothetical protein
VLAANIMASPDRLDFFARHPNTVANPAAGTLNLARSRRAWTVVRSAGAWIERPRARESIAFRDHGPGAVLPLFAPIPRADLDTALRPNRFAGVGFADPLPLLLHRAIASNRYLLDVLFVNRTASGPPDGYLVLLPDGFANRVAVFADMLFVDRPIRAITLRHLVLLPHRFADRVTVLAAVLFVDRPIGAVALWYLVFLPDRSAHRIAALADMLLVDRPVGAVAHRHLVLLPDGPADRVTTLADMLLVDRPADRVLTDSVILFPHRFADGVAAFADVLFVDRLANGVTALVHDRVVNRAVANRRLLLDDRPIADAVPNRRDARLFRSTAGRWVYARPAVCGPNFGYGASQADDRDKQR